MIFLKKKKGLEVQLSNKVIFLRGHQDNDAFTVFTESLFTHPSLSESEVKAILSAIQERYDIVVK